MVLTGAEPVRPSRPRRHIVLPPLSPPDLGKVVVFGGTKVPPSIPEPALGCDAKVPGGHGSDSLVHC